MNNRRNPGIGYRPVVPIERAHRSIFDEGDRTKMPLIVFGSGLQGREQVRFPGLQHGASNVIYKHLKVKEKQGHLCLLDIDEFKTSKETLDNLIAADGQTIHAILICNNCNIYWNRDVNAAKNMFSITEAMWAGEGRPAEFTRPPRQAN